MSYQKEILFSISIRLFVFSGHCCGCRGRDTRTHFCSLFYCVATRMTFDGQWVSDGRLRLRRSRPAPGPFRSAPAAPEATASSLHSLAGRQNLPISSLWALVDFINSSGSRAPEATQRDSCYHIGYRHRALNYFLWCKRNETSGRSAIARRYVRPTFCFRGPSYPFCYLHSAPRDVFCIL